MTSQTIEIRGFILQAIAESPKEVSRKTAEKFGISRSAVSKHLRQLAEEGLIEAEGTTRARVYRLRDLLDENHEVEVVRGVTDESFIWALNVLPHVRDLPNNVLRMCEYGFTEMMNNAIEHSGSDKARITVRRNAWFTEFAVRDFGIGIFTKLQRDCGLTDARHAAFELSKGKLTTDARTHTGLGIFYTSRMFDEFYIWSEDLSFIRSADGENWILESTPERKTAGTLVCMRIRNQAAHTLEQVFSRYGSDSNELALIRTHISMNLLKYEGEQLVSRSQARRLLARLERFGEAFLDFSGIATIGHSFADEIFRVYRRDHPHTRLVPFNTTHEIDKVIESAKVAAAIEDQGQMSLF